MIVSLCYGEDFSISLDDEMGDSYSPTRTSEMVDQCARLLTEALAVTKASRTRTVKAKDQ